MSEREGLVLMPAMGEGIIEAKLVRWLKRPGDTITKDEPFVEVATDKVDSEIPAPHAGVLAEIFVTEGDHVMINAPLARIQSAAAGVAAGTQRSFIGKQDPTMSGNSLPSRSAAPSSYVSSSAAATASPKSSPLVRKMAKEHQVDLGTVSGSGLGGRITRQDLEPIIAGRTDNHEVVATASSSVLPQVLQKQVRVNPMDQNEGPAALPVKVIDGQEYLEGVRVRREKMSHMRQLIAEHMIRSARTSPHVTTTFEIDLNRVQSIRDQHKDNFQKREGFSLTFTSFFVYSAALAIKQHPIVNVSVDGTDVLFKTDINIGVAVSLGEQGLIVPVIRNAGELNLLGVARRLNDVVTRARSKKLNPDDVRGGTFSITNPGSYGSLQSNPLINQPQVAMLSVGCITKRPVVLPGDLIGIRPMMIAGLTFDHRVVDGEAGARFLATFRDILENFSEAPV